MNGEIEALMRIAFVGTAMMLNSIKKGVPEVVIDLCKSLACSVSNNLQVRRTFRR